MLPQIASASWRHFEKRGIELRRIAGVRPDARMDPFALAAKLGLKVIFPEMLEGLSRDALLILKSSGGWSGGVVKGLFSASGPIVLNSADSVRRRNATLMEEICHLLLRHKASQIGLQFDGCRTHNHRIEEQAYGIGSAALLPYESLYARINSKTPVPDIADHFGVTQSLVLYRIRKFGLAATLS